MWCGGERGERGDAPACGTLLLFITEDGEAHRAHKPNINDLLVAETGGPVIHALLFGEIHVLATVLIHQEDALGGGGLEGREPVGGNRCEHPTNRKGKGGGQEGSSMGWMDKGGYENACHKGGGGVGNHPVDSSIIPVLSAGWSVLLTSKYCSKSRPWMRM